MPPPSPSPTLPNRDPDLTAASPRPYWGHTPAPHQQQHLRLHLPPHWAHSQMARWLTVVVTRACYQGHQPCPCCHRDTLGKRVNFETRTMTRTVWRFWGGPLRTLDGSASVWFHLVEHFGHACPLSGFFYSRQRMGLSARLKTVKGKRHCSLSCAKNLCCGSFCIEIEYKRFDFFVFPLCFTSFCWGSVYAPFNIEISLFWIYSYVHFILSTLFSNMSSTIY